MLEWRGKVWLSIERLWWFQTMSWATATRRGSKGLPHMGLTPTRARIFAGEALKVSSNSLAITPLLIPFTLYSSSNHGGLYHDT